jgi:hypothetical protein
MSSLSDNLNNNIDFKSKDFKQALIEVCEEIRKDEGWKSIEGGLLGSYFENKSHKKIPILKKYYNYFNSLDFNEESKDYFRKNFKKHLFYESYIKNFDAVIMTYENDNCKVLFVYAKKNKKKEVKIKNPSMKSLKEQMMKEAERLNNIIESKSTQEKVFLQFFPK